MKARKIEMFLLPLSKVIIISILYFNLVQSSSYGVHNELQQCNQTSGGVHVLYNNRKGNDVEVVCLKKDKEYRWRLMDGSSTYGEQFNPANDCSDIVDQLPNPENGFYWATRNTTNPLKVWCDVDTDGGGFMLVGMKESPVSWTVPSNSTPVHPNGPQHWSSVLGDTEVQDFGIQFSSDGTFEGTEEHWFYHLKEKRQLRNLFTNDESTGCTKNDPGIGDVMYVKDVRTGSIATTNFRCSIFGPHTHPNLGWARMNYCLDHDCKNGYGVFPGPFPFQYAQHGSFSYSAVSSLSGTRRNSTAFVGCDHGKCCACFGPKGGKKSYCGPACTSVNGGTVLKQAFVWFWVRTRRPKRLWKRCMEFRMKNTAGKLENYFIDPKTGTVREGSCSRKFKSFLNEGTLTVLDKKGFERIPHVTGLLLYRVDKKQLYVNEGSEWKALSTVQELQKIRQKVENQESIINIQENRVQNQENVSMNQQNAIQNLKTKIQTQGNKIQTQENKIQNQENKIQNQENKIQAQENKIQTQENKIQTQENKIQTQEHKIQSQENKIETQEKNIKKLEKEYQGILNLIGSLHPPSCSKLKKTRPSTSSGTYFINPEGLASSPLVQVYCDMTSKNGVGVTAIGHDSESKTYVNGYESSGSYKRKISYDISKEQIVAVMKQSKNCEQFIKYECHASGLWLASSPPDGWWVSRQGLKMNYWGGARVNSGKCACGMTNSCAGGNTCNCDKNDETWREDSGYLTDKNTLPVDELRFGDTGRSVEAGYHTLGKLRCWG